MIYCVTVERSLRAFVSLTLIVAASASNAAQAESSPSDGQSMMQAFLRNEARRLDAQFLDAITNRAQWETRRAELREQYLEMLGLWPMPERTPLQPQITGVLERDEGFRVEKLHFQSRPGLYVTGNLYVPKDAKAGAKLPAVLYVCGHSGKGRDGNKTAFQHHGMWFATHGYVCLIIDTLQLGEIAAIHHGTYRYNRWWWQARGYTPAGVECWNGIRALDYLQSRPEVDPERLAVTGISGGGAATFWIAAADERVKVAVPVSGMGDLEDYVGEKVVNGHCDCMFMINTFQWPWTQIAALVAPRPLLFANSGHDTIFPMNGNDRIRSRLERLYGFYTNRTDRLFDIAVTPGGHDDKVELRLMAYRWINRHLKGDDSPVTEPELPKIEGKLLRAFPDELPKDELNTKIDEVFVPLATNALPQSLAEFQSWREVKLAELKRIVVRDVAAPFIVPHAREFENILRSHKAATGEVSTHAGVFPRDFAYGAGVVVPVKFLPAATALGRRVCWLVVLGEEDSLRSKPNWVDKIVGDNSVLLVAPRGTAPLNWEDPSPFFVKRSLSLLGYTPDRCRLVDVVTVATMALAMERGGPSEWKIVGRGTAGVLAAYAALWKPRLSEVVVVDPPASHRDGPIFLNVLRVLDVPEALGLLAPRPLTIRTSKPAAFSRTESIYRIANGVLKLQANP